MSDEPTRRRRPLHTRIFIGLLAGTLAGLSANLIWGGAHARLGWIIAHVTEPIGQLFLRLLLMTVIPLVFSSLVVGIAGIGDIRKLGRVGLKTFGYCLVVSTISVLIGTMLANAIRPGQRIAPATAAELQQKYGREAATVVEKSRATDSAESPLMQIMKTLVPANPMAAMAADPPNMLHLMFFTVVFGLALTLIGPVRAPPLLDALEGVYAVSTKIIDLIMRAAPYAVACLLFNSTARFGFDLLQALGWFMATVVLGLALHMFGTYSLTVWLLARLSPWEFFRRIRTAMLTAFSTSSSAATLPTTLRVGEEELGVPREINSFVLTVGATANQNGTALYEGVTVLFLAQLAGVDLTFGQQLIVAYLAILGGIGTAGVPSASIPFVVAVLMSIGVNPALIAVIIGVDRILDMCRTVLNVTGDLAAATYVARSEGCELLKRKP